MESMEPKKCRKEVKTQNKGLKAAKVVKIGIMVNENVCHLVSLNGIADTNEDALLYIRGLYSVIGIELVSDKKNKNIYLTVKTELTTQ